MEISKEKFEDLVLKKQKGYDNSSIRIELSNLGYTPQQIKEITLKVDDVYLEQIKSRERLKKVNKTFLGGLLLFIIGFTILIVTYVGVVDLKGYFIIPYGTILSGLNMMILSRVSKRKKTRGQYFTSKKQF